MIIGEYSPRRSRGEYSPIITETEVNNCFSIISVVKYAKISLHIATCTSVMNIIYFLFKYAMSKVIGNSSKQQALNGRTARKVLKFT